MSILTDISENLQRGKAKIVKELVQQAIDEGIPVQQILDEGLLSGMGVIGEKFKNNEVFVPEVLVAARAILGEWLAGSGGGWQDSGGVWPGIKLIEGVHADEGDPEHGVSRGRLLPRHSLLGPDDDFTQPSTPTARRRTAPGAGADGGRGGFDLAADRTPPLSQA